VKVNQATHSVGMMCRLLDVSRSGFYTWAERPMCLRRRGDLQLTGKICAIHRRSRETYCLTSTIPAGGVNYSCRSRASLNDLPQAGLPPKAAEGLVRAAHRQRQHQCDVARSDRLVSGLIRTLPLAPHAPMCRRHHGAQPSMEEWAAAAVRETWREAGHDAEVARHGSVVLDLRAEV